MDIKSEIIIINNELLKYIEIKKNFIEMKLIIYIREIKFFKIIMLKIIQNQDLNKLCNSLLIFDNFNFISYTL